MLFISKNEYDSIHADFKSDKTILKMDKSGATVAVPYTILAGEYVQSDTGRLGGNDIYITVSFDRKKDWKGGYIENSNYTRIVLKETFEVEQFALSMYQKGKGFWFENRLNMKMRKAKCKSLEHAIEKIQAYLSEVAKYYNS